MSVCQSVSLSVTHQYSVEMAKVC